MRSLIICGVTLALLFPLMLKAELRLPQVLSDGMVLQREQPLKLWGRAQADGTLELSFRGQTHSVQVDSEGRWQITLPPQTAGGPYDLSIEGPNSSLRLEDVLVGDLWLASGQSNMELPMDRTAPLYPEERERGRDPHLRYFDVPDRYHFQAPLEDLEGGHWRAVTPETIGSMSAVAYFFAKELRHTYQVPIGIINASLGGSPVEAWMSEPALEEFPSLLHQARRFQNPSLIAAIEAADQARADSWYGLRDREDRGLVAEPDWSSARLDDSGWAEMDMPAALPERLGLPVNGVWWLRKEFELPEAWAGQPALLELGRLVDADTTYVNGRQVGQTGYQYPPRRYSLPKGLLKEGRNQIAIRLTSERGPARMLRGKEYQLLLGEESLDLTGPWRYRLGVQMPKLESQTFIRWQPLGLYNGMIAPLVSMNLKGVIWYQGESNVGRARQYAELFPGMIRDWRTRWDREELPFVYVQLANYLEATSGPTDSDWARLREAQTTALELPNTGMAVAIDIGEWNDIHPLDKKTVGERLARSAQAVAYGEPDMEPTGPLYRSMKVQSDQAILNFDHAGEGLASCDGEPLRQFSIAGRDRHFRWAKAEVEKNTVRVWHPGIKTPKAVRYAWADNPEGANLCDASSLPASPFRTDNWSPSD